MGFASVRYSFTQSFSVPARDAFEWATDYEPKDWALMGLEGRRKVKKLSEDALILEDTQKTDKGLTTKMRLVRLNPDRLTLSSTHISGPNLHSQFWYAFVSEGAGGSRLEFTGLLLYPSDKVLPASRVSKIAASERKADAAIWKNLAKAMESDLSKGSA